MGALEHGLPLGLAGESLHLGGGLCLGSIGSINRGGAGHQATMIRKIGARWWRELAAGERRRVRARVRKRDRGDPELMIP